MIYTITPNPALDLGGTVKTIVPNEKMYVQNETRFPGGNAVNAARVIRGLGVPVIASGFLGGGVGEEFRMLLKKERVRHQFVEISGHTRISLTVTNESNGRQTRLSFPGPKIRPPDIKNLESFLARIPDHSFLVLGGSLPPGFEIAQLGRIIRNARRRGIQMIVDVPGKYLRAVLEFGPLMIKPNLTEFQELAQSSAYKTSDVLREAQRLTSQIPMICISSVEGGALFVTRDAAWFGRGPKIKVASTVGAGDSMVGAISAALWKFQQKSKDQPFNVSSLPDGGILLRWGLAAALATLITPGTQLGDNKSIQSFYPKVMIKKIE
ncbi:MAG TPA: hypothetical protein DCS07_06415 [Bdellovibrionales bacterium]|nr:MAG: hypothetical protein A2Z97_13570 [Bdellovibrionales bacterium GWB1_52_6]OFZ06072.1 MAG: hypothetical protein A2X97_01920 [Bdellovibrionales bacterium GWA1_52_35]OFZ35187.1 MAG: hypothetical protein A2070_10250 [Bdellovibrionales bacterium GWC1_52_8]HAR42250.1 hypothetical protein [Bdellovibrionales bacterium]HCM39302.1 hypothetical protein [Bdellovibrionales bacterium]